MAVQSSELKPWRLKLVHLGLSFPTCKMGTLGQIMVLNFMN